MIEKWERELKNQQINRFCNFLTKEISDKDVKQKEKSKCINKMNEILDKEKNKEALQKEVGLPIDEKIALVGLISRFVWQKGAELITKELMDLPCQFVFLGTGQKKYEDYFRKLAKKYPNKVSSQIKFNIKLAQMIYAGSDIFLMVIPTNITAIMKKIRGNIRN